MDKPPDAPSDGGELTSQQIARWRAGDHSVEFALFARFRAELLESARRDRLMRFLRSRTTPEDLVNDVFRRALSSGFFRTFEARSRGAVHAGLQTILERVLVDACRHHGAAKRGANAPAPSFDELGMGVPSATDPTPTSAARAGELLELCRSHLTAREWDIWRLAEIDGLDSADIARRLDTTSSAVRGVLLRARVRLVKVLGDATGQ